MQHNGIERQPSLLTPAQSVLSNNFENIKFGLLHNKEKHSSLVKHFSSNNIELNKKTHKTYREVLQCEDYQKNINNTSEASSSLLARIRHIQGRVNKVIASNESQMDSNEEKLEQIDYMKRQMADTKKKMLELAAITKEEKQMNIQNKVLSRVFLARN